VPARPSAAPAGGCRDRRRGLDRLDRQHEPTDEDRWLNQEIERLWNQLAEERRAFVLAEVAAGLVLGQLMAEAGDWTPPGGPSRYRFRLQRASKNRQQACAGCFSTRLLVWWQRAGERLGRV